MGNEMSENRAAEKRKQLNALFKKMNNLRVSDLYTCNLLKMYYKLYRKMLPVYFESFIPEYGDCRHNLRNDQIRLPLIRCEYGKLNVKYQMHLRYVNYQLHPTRTNIHLLLSMMTHLVNRILLSLSI